MSELVDMVCLDILIWVMTVYAGFYLFVLVWFPYSKVVFLKILMVLILEGLRYSKIIFPPENLVVVLIAEYLLLCRYGFGGEICLDCYLEVFSSYEG